MQEIYDLLNKFIETHKNLETANDICKILKLLGAKVKNNNWSNEVQELIHKLRDKYPPLSYFIENYKNKVKIPYSSTAVLNNYLTIAGLCIDTELFIDCCNNTSIRN